MFLECQVHDFTRPSLRGTCWCTGPRPQNDRLRPCSVALTSLGCIFSQIKCCWNYRTASRALSGGCPGRPRGVKDRVPRRHGSGARYTLHYSKDRVHYMTRITLEGLMCMNPQQSTPVLDGPERWTPNYLDEPGTATLERTITESGLNRRAATQAKAGQPPPHQNRLCSRQQGGKRPT
jgi:hypothetical protein